jgi:hypothetical protein
MPVFFLHKTFKLIIGMEKLILSFFTLIFWSCPSLIFSQTYFQKIYQSSPFDQEAQDVLPMTDGGYLLAGYTTNSTINDCDVYIIKTDAVGNLLWTKTYGGNKPDFPYHMLATNDSNYFIIGYSQSYGGGDYDILLMKIDTAGNLLWTKTYGGNGNDMGRDVIATSDGNYMIVGSSNSPGLADQNANLIKIDPAGTVLWSKLFGGSANDYGNGVRQTSDGGFIMIGQTFSFSSPGGDAYLVKMDVNGDTTWTKRFGGAYSDEGNYITVNPDGSYVFLVRDSSSAGRDIDVRIIKTDNAGNEIWNKVYGGNLKDTPKMIQPTMDGGYIVGAISRSFGWMNPDMWILKLTTTGDTTWTRHYGGSQNEHCYVVRELPDGSFIACGKTSSFGPDFDPIFLKLNPNGTLAVGINEFAISQNNIKLYPNPTTGIFNLDVGDVELSEISVKNVLGEEIYLSRKELSNTTIDLNGQKPGVYFLTAESPSGKVSAKFIIN